MPPGCINHPRSGPTSIGPVGMKGEITHTLGLMRYCLIGLLISIVEALLFRRVTFLGGPGYKIKQSNSSMVLPVGGGAFSRERYYAQGLVRSAERALGIDAQFFKLYSP